MPSTTDADTGAPADLSAFEQQLPLHGEFVSQRTETAGEVEIARRSDGTVWATLTNFSTGSSPNLRLYLNEGALVKNADGAWSAESGAGYDIAANIGPSGSQQFEIPGSYGMPEIHSVTVFDFTAPDFYHFGSAPLG
ncbi:DM13 domain-containing protein [Leifsonia sp. YAF41]|uniref:DM13 domain-containing protein n=1 Tax=Leifsonia sp. YAF41 TaxID=3233086 RepID=UPI003F96490C